MGENTKIEWADSSFNFWTGCTKVSDACTFCYAESWAKRTGHPELWEGERRRTSVANWRKPLIWDRKLDDTGRRQRVFTNSLADFFDNQVPEEWRIDAWATIDATPNLDWLILTKRPQNIHKMLPPNWGNGWPGVWLGTTVENQEEADRRIPHLLAVPARVRFLSCEPLLGDTILHHPWLGWKCAVCNERAGSIDACNDCDPCIGAAGRRFIDLVIAGGESGPHARELDKVAERGRSLRDQCKAGGAAFFFKQMGGKRKPFAPIPDDLMIREFPR